MRTESIQRAAPAVVVRVARARGLEYRLVKGEFGLLAAILEQHRQHRLGTGGIALGVGPEEGAREPLGFPDLAIHSLKPVIRALGRAHVKAVGAARTDIHFA